MIKKILHGKTIRTVVFYYVSFILISTVILKLPFLLNEGQSISWLDAFFTSNSAIATTGLSLFDYTVTYNYFGWLVLILLFNVGGMGILVLNTFVIILFRKKVGYKHRHLAKTDFNQINESSIVSVVKAVVIFFLVFEMLGTILIFLGAGHEYNTFIERFMSSWFLSASAISGSGFFNFTPFINNFYVQWVTIFLMWISFIGFPVIVEVFWYVKAKYQRKNFVFSRFTKIVVKMNLITIILFAVLFIMIENDKAMQGMPFLQQLNYALFMSTSMKSVGLSVFVDMTALAPITLFLSTIFMLVGGSPSSACGGVKVVAIYVVFKYIIATFKGKADVIAYDFIIPSKTVTNSFLLIFLFIGISIATTIIIMIIQPHQQLLHVWFDVISAFTTTGFSTGALAMMSTVPIIIMSILMGIGRIGIMNIMNLSEPGSTNDERIKFVEKDIAI
jgi:Trk-type K+ transport system membrane component